MKLEDWRSVMLQDRGIKFFGLVMGIDVVGIDVVGMVGV